MINSLRLNNFRTYKEDSFEFKDGVSIIVGPNASGKTNLLEAILVACKGGSFRARDESLINHNALWTRIEADIDGDQRSVYIEKKNGVTKKQYTINTQKFSRLPFIKTIPTVIFEPEHLQLLQAGPDKRRDFLDDLIEHSLPGFGQKRREYKRSLAQRNKLLKNSKSPSQDEVFVWNVRMSEAGGYLVEQRLAMIERINQQITDLYSSISGKTVHIDVRYKTTLNSSAYGSQLLKSLEANFARDRERGFTGDGPHRDDLEIYINNHNAQTSASRGEVRTLLLALKLLELSIVEESREKRPILLLDDVFSELDGLRRRLLTQYLESYQSFITTTDADVVVQHFMGQCEIIPTAKS